MKRTPCVILTPKLLLLFLAQLEESACDMLAGQARGCRVRLAIVEHPVPFFQGMDNELKRLTAEVTGRLRPPA